MGRSRTCLTAVELGDCEILTSHRSSALTGFITISLQVVSYEGRDEETAALSQKVPDLESVRRKQGARMGVIWDMVRS